MRLGSEGCQAARRGGERAEGISQGLPGLSENCCHEVPPASQLLPK